MISISHPRLFRPGAADSRSSHASKYAISIWRFIDVIITIRAFCGRVGRLTGDGPRAHAAEDDGHGDCRLTERAQGHRELPIATGNSVGLEEIPGDTDCGLCAPDIGRLDKASICRPRSSRACLWDNSGIRGSGCCGGFWRSSSSRILRWLRATVRRFPQNGNQFTNCYR